MGFRESASDGVGGTIKWEFTGGEIKSDQEGGGMKRERERKTKTKKTKEEEKK